MTIPLSDEELAAIEARAASATPGPWKSELDIFDPEGQAIVACFSDEGINVLGMLETDERAPTGPLDDAWERARASQEMKDATFCAHAREDIPRLLAEIRRLRGKGT